MSQLDEVRQMVRQADTIFRRVECDQRRDAMLVRLGMTIGYERGVDDSDDRDAKSWAKMAAWLRRSANSPSYDELCRRRGETKPCPTRCHTCATCRRAAAYWRRQADKL